jgi:predicted dehydrogenase
LTFLICGLGSIGKRHLRILKELGEFKFIALRSGKSNTEALGIADIEITEISNISEFKTDGALITNPTSLHIETAIEIAKAGIPMFIEKPLGKDLNRIDELIEIVKKKNLPVLMGYNFIFHPGIAEIKRLISEDKIGKVLASKSQFGTYMPGWHPEENYKESYAAKKSLGGGVVLTSIHEQNYLTDLFGDIIDIKAMEVSGNEIGIESEEAVEILLKHKSGVVSNIHLNFFQKPYYRNCQIIGSEGTIFWDFMKPEVKVLYKDKSETINLGGTAMELLDISYKNQMKHFIEVVKRKSEPVTTLENGINDMKTALKILNEIGRN